MNLRALRRRIIGPRRREPAPVILMYHRIADLESDPWELAVTPTQFEAHLDFLQTKRTPLPAADFMRLLVAGKLPQDAVLLSFDDGYVDNLHHAMPVLAAAGMSAILFVATSWIDAREPFWWDELAGLILDHPDPVDCRMSAANRELHIRFGARETSDENQRGWRASQPPRTMRQASYVDTWTALRDLAPGSRKCAMAKLRELLGPYRGAGRNRSMTEAELREIADSGSFDLGGHTVTHPRLPQLDPGEQRREIADGKARIEAISGRPISGFAYPYGAIDSSARQAVIDCDFEWACTTESRTIDCRKFDRFALPRVAAPAGDAAALEKLLVGTL
jgi:peptidoglycan/xylan/chitin deacetylase (PgdA/CDA1 family)